MRKITLAIFILLIIPLVFQTRSVYATSSGFERFKDNQCEIFLEYFPIVPYNPHYPTAVEEFPIKFHIWQNVWWEGPWYDPRQMVPRLFKIDVYYRCDSCGGSDYVLWKRWYPTSTTQYGLIISWSLSGEFGPLTLSTSVQGPEVFGYHRDYTKYYEDYEGKTYLHLSYLGAEYRSTQFWGPVDVYGGGSIGIPSDVATSHYGHHVLVRVEVLLIWLNLDWLGVPRDIYQRTFNFILGDDIPSDSDCWLTVQRGSTNFQEYIPQPPPSPSARKTRGGGGGRYGPFMR
jgi:hypothetical protein